MFRSWPTAFTSPLPICQASESPTCRAAAIPSTVSRRPRRKIREILGQPEPKKYQRRVMPSVVDRFKPIIDAIVRADEEAPRKQRHTVAKIFRRLRDEHAYPGSYGPRPGIAPALGLRAGSEASPYSRRGLVRMRASRTL